MFDNKGSLLIDSLFAFFIYFITSSIIISLYSIILFSYNHQQTIYQEYNIEREKKENSQWYQESIDVIITMVLQ